MNCDPPPQKKKPATPWRIMFLAYVGEGSAVRGGIWEIFLGGGVVFWPSGGGKGFDLKGGERGGKFFF